MCLLLLAVLWARLFVAGYAFERAAAMLRDRCDCELTAGRVELALTSLTFTLHDVRCPVQRPLPPLAVAERASVDTRLAATSVGEPAFDWIELINPKLSWTPASGLALRGRSQPGPLPVVTIGRLDIGGLDADIAASRSARLTVHGLSTSLAGGGPGRLSGPVRVGHGVRLEAGDVAGELDQVSAELAIDGAAVSIGSLVARSPAGDVRLNGRVGFADAGSYGLEVRR